MSHTITHNGFTFTAINLPSFHTLPIWPIEEYLVRTRHTKNVAERIKRLNPEGKEEGAGPRGWHPHRRAPSGYNWGIREFIGKFGRDAYYNLPKTALMRDGHRKSITVD